MLLGWVYCVYLFYERNNVHEYFHMYAQYLHLVRKNWTYNIKNKFFLMREKNIKLKEREKIVINNSWFNQVSRAGEASKETLTTPKKKTYSPKSFNLQSHNYHFQYTHVNHQKRMIQATRSILWFGFLLCKLSSLFYICPRNWINRICHLSKFNFHNSLLHNIRCENI